MSGVERFWDATGAIWILIAVGVHYLPQWGFPVPFALASAFYAALVVVGIIRLVLAWLGVRRSVIS